MANLRIEKRERSNGALPARVEAETRKDALPPSIVADPLDAPGKSEFRGGPGARPTLADTVAETRTTLRKLSALTKVNGLGFSERSDTEARQQMAAALRKLADEVEARAVQPVIAPDPPVKPAAAEARTARTEACTALYTLFQRPGRDDTFRAELASALGAIGVDPAVLALRPKPDTTLRREHAEKARALLAVARDGELPLSLRRLALERLGPVGGPNELVQVKTLERAEPLLAKAATKAARDISKGQKLSIVLCAWEVQPYAGTGGLSNVMSELPRALAKMGHKVTVIAPRHEAIDSAAFRPVGGPATVLGPEGAQQFQLLKDRKDGVDFVFVENDKYFSRDRSGLYGDDKGDYPDNAERYDFFSAAIPAAIRALGPTVPDVVQLNDSHTAAAALYLKGDPSFAGAKTVVAVHNMGGAYQGKFDVEHLQRLRFDGLGEFFPGGPAEFYGQVNLLKLGIVKADAVITVSRQYMRETLEPQNGAGLHGVMQWLQARDRLWGNLNGIDPETRNPATDPHLQHHFSASDPAGKALCKRELQRQFGLAQKPNTPILGMVGRLTEQKGFDDTLALMRASLERGDDVQYVVCGDGDPTLKAELLALAARFKGSIGFDPVYSVEKDHRLHAGSDFYLMPSRFEPCGLPQMYAMRYLTVPIVRAVGGLEESVQDFDPATGKGNGIKFTDDLQGGVTRALALYRAGGAGMKRLHENCAASDFSWENTAALEQVAFYRKTMDA